MWILCTKMESFQTLPASVPPQHMRRPRRGGHRVPPSARARRRLQGDDHLEILPHNPTDRVRLFQRAGFPSDWLKARNGNWKEAQTLRRE